MSVSLLTPHLLYAVTLQEQAGQRRGKRGRHHLDAVIVHIEHPQRRQHRDLRRYVCEQVAKIDERADRNLRRVQLAYFFSESTSRGGMRPSSISS